VVKVRTPATTILEVKMVTVLTKTKNPTLEYRRKKTTVPRKTQQQQQNLKQKTQRTQITQVQMERTQVQMERTQSTKRK